MACILPISKRTLIHGVPIPLKIKNYWAVSVALFILIITPYLHIGVFYLKLWVPDKQPVNKKDCTCSCFDTVFKGSYESPGRTRYKHIYFNATQNTFKIWSVTVVFMMMFYESIKYLIGLYQIKQLHLSWLCLYLVNIYPNYYSWWMMFGYFNDEFYKYLSHQIYFCVTEVVVTALVLNLCNKQSETHSWKILVIIAISFAHIFVSSLDQFITNIILFKGEAFQNSRDFGLMIPDLLHLFVAGYWYIRLISYNDVSNNCNKNKEIQVGMSVLSKVCANRRKQDLMFLVVVMVVLVSLSHLL